MKTLTALFALLALCSACSETTFDGPTYAGMGRGSIAADDAPAPRARVAEGRAFAARDSDIHPHVLRREGEIVVCAQCR